MEFKFYFGPMHAEPYYEYADLIIEDIPINSMRDPPEGLRNFAATVAHGKSKVPEPTYVGSNTQHLSVPLMQFNLRGQGNFCKLAIEPPMIQFEEELFIGKEYQKKIQLKK